jgi:hypothetical protein
LASSYSTGEYLDYEVSGDVTLTRLVLLL